MKFLGEENIYDSEDKSFGVVISVPFEFSSSYGKGASSGPSAILEASQYLELYDEVLDIEPDKEGIWTAEPLQLDDSPEVALKQIKSTVEKYISKGKFIIALGGEHSISMSVHTAIYEKYKNLSVLHLDAHADLRDEYEGTRFSHACVMRRIWEKNRNIVQCGIRSLSKEEADFINKYKINTFFSHQMRKVELWDEIISKLNDNVFLTMDVDFFDPSIMPATGTPEPGGFYWNETIAFLQNLFKIKNVVGCDVVELSPIHHLSHPDFLAAKLVYKLFAFRLQYLKNKNILDS